MSVGQYFQDNLSKGQIKPGLRIHQATGPSYIVTTGHYNLVPSVLWTLYPSLCCPRTAGAQDTHTHHTGLWCQL